MPKGQSEGINPRTHTTMGKVKIEYKETNDVQCSITRKNIMSNTKTTMKRGINSR